jgi:hypothetical protein
LHAKRSFLATADDTLLLFLSTSFAELGHKLCYSISSCRTATLLVATTCSPPWAFAFVKMFARRHSIDTAAVTWSPKMSEVDPGQSSASTTWTLVSTIKEVLYIEINVYIFINDGCNSGIGQKRTSG